MEGQGLVLSKVVIDNNTGKVFPPPARYMGLIFIIFGAAFLFGNILFGSFFTLLGYFLNFTVSGTQIDIATKKYRAYTKYFGIKTGEWISIDAYPFITIVGKTMGYTFQGPVPGQKPLSERERFCAVCLLSANHRQKLTVQIVKDIVLARKSAQDLAIKLGLQIVNYQPEVSAKTMERRERRKK